MSWAVVRPAAFLKALAPKFVAWARQPSHAPQSAEASTPKPIAVTVSGKPSLDVRKLRLRPEVEKPLLDAGMPPEGSSLYDGPKRAADTPEKAVEKRLAEIRDGERDHVRYLHDTDAADRRLAAMTPEVRQLRLVRAVKNVLALVSPARALDEKNVDLFRELMPRLQELLQELVTALREHGERLPHREIPQIVTALYGLAPRPELHRSYEALLPRLQDLERYQAQQRETAKLLRAVGKRSS